MLNKIFKLDLQEADKSVYIWAILSGVLYSGSTMILSVVCSWCFGQELTGIYTVALTMGNQLITIGYWNTRTYQASDITERVKFNDYFSLKVITTILMLVIGMIWVKIKGYSSQECIAIMIMTVFKCIEVFGDVFEGRYQQKKRFDISSKSLLLRTLTFIVSFVITAVITKNLIISLAVMTICYALAFMLIDARLIKHFGGLKVKFNMPNIQNLAIACFPLFVNSFLLMYINNEAKYAVRDYLGNAILAKFNYLYMIAFVINMFSSVILKPIINQLSELYMNKELKKIIKILARQGLLILGLTVCCIIGAYLLGTQILSIVYHTDLTMYKMELCILILGGACTALYQVFQNIIIVMRHQYSCLIGCTITSAFTFVITPMFVKSMGISGGAFSYLATMLLMSTIYGLITAYFFIKEK